MTDIELTKRCAEACGWHCEPAEDDRYRIYEATEDMTPIFGIGEWLMQRYDPLHDDAQAMALIKKFDIKVTKRPQYESWRAVAYHRTGEFLSIGTDYNLNRAIVLCVAGMPSHPPVIGGGR